ncbi:hypothetical protein EOA27_01135 [Mesorhizobium sp. M2A.F.Ca.ET.037.01.1.1]|uniref:hypothetical protein n=1 Tax=unclassified Mesorhizobium TaxID=325217 RepID=UPI000F75A1E9|nr:MULTISPECIES: hypothetical protein [unclassified Mesorhizobium]RVC70101.1 hypothetical protein EN759_05265 [Mesorhizobium sp. M00.F.Ca.ET.038.03.1.1]RVC82550.1 hypothetical protein EN766_00760 [Mesorhizobium sp. M2A.F.Ca.ET.046.02.1.1]AZO34693.1 hypothetical protein EJ072_09670 [Mesorhizobium sp. M2A.F.Ca.ET.046.03.2.1]RUX23259.1 hypothetical protein EOA27_01135 [Mesorhizobium sp. M2A.F.Ca.ET.037.01.1.1]RWA92920.1 MAG: hypothetical protein EOQ31_04205 [Mesorhizobium sp.]
MQIQLAPRRAGNPDREQAMQHYRLYVLDDRGQFKGGINLTCIDDVAAKEQARLLADGHEVELWRLVARFKSDNPRSRPAATKRMRAVAPRSSHFNKVPKHSHSPLGCGCASWRCSDLDNMIPIQALWHCD